MHDEVLLRIIQLDLMQCFRLIVRKISQSIFNVFSSSPVPHTGLFISPSGISELDCATTKTDKAEMSYQ